MKTITLGRVVHKGEPRVTLRFPYDEELTSIVRKLTDARWSKSMKCWHVFDTGTTPDRIFSLFQGIAEIDNSEITVSSQRKLLPKGINSDEESNKSEDNSDKLRSGRASEEYFDYYIRGENISENEGPDKYGAVMFTINESDGRLLIKFTGKYEQDWIRELKEYGKPFYDKYNREWLLRWSQLTVDSLSDYFSSRGVEVIVKKSKVAEVIKDRRNDLSLELHRRELSGKSERYIDQVANYLEEKRYSKRTYDSYLAYLRLFFRYLNDKDPEAISADDVSVFLNEFVIGSGYSASYQNLLISAIKMFFRLTGKGRMDIEGISRPRKGRALPKVLSKEEVMKIFSVTRNSKHKLMLWLIYSCGLRRSEVINIRLTHLDKERGVLQIREGKGNVDRMVPIPGKVWDKIDIYLNSYKPVTYLFEGQSGGKYSVESVYSVFKQSLKRAGIKKDVGVHCLRHSYATHLHEGGLDIRYIQELLGHKSSRTTEIYTHVSRRNLFAIRSPIEDMDLE
jgi:integrase/recombinase XerD